MGLQKIVTVLYDMGNTKGRKWKIMEKDILTLKKQRNKEKNKNSDMKVKSNQITNGGNKKIKHGR